MDWVFYAALATVTIHLVGTPILLTDIRKRYPDLFESIGGYSVFLNPFKQLDLLSWIVARRYSIATGRATHIYDLYLVNFVLFLLFMLILAISG